MCHTPTAELDFFASLLRQDQCFAEQVQAKGCEHCGSPLHQAHYQRKPRGLPPELRNDEAYARRYSFCCCRCRRRHTPVSLRFLGRRVYSAFCLLMASFQGCFETAAIQQLSVPKLTLYRWQQWWNGDFKQTRVWRALTTKLQPVTRLPDDWWRQLGGATWCERGWQMLGALLPLTSQSSRYFRMSEFTQNL